MTANEIKNAWNTFKKEIKKELTFDLTGCCYMNAKQIQNGTATICLCNDIEYDNDIAESLSSIERVNGYNAWTAEEKKRSEAKQREYIKFIENQKATYGTKANEAKTKNDAIIASNAYKKLAASIGIHDAELEFVHKWAGLNLYQVRISY